MDALVDRVMAVAGKRQGTAAADILLCHLWPERRSCSPALELGGEIRANGYRSLSRGGIPRRPRHVLDFPGRIIVRLLAQQTASGSVGHVAEIGVFEGRLLIAMALSLADGERALAVDHFTWPDPGVRGRFEANCAAHGVPVGCVVVRQGDSRLTTPEQIMGCVGGAIRFFHIDGEHTAEHLSNDLHLAFAVMAPDGIVVLDDMLHPGYPTLALTVHTILDAHPDWQVLAILDREDIVCAAKYVICRKPMVRHYSAWLRAEFSTYVWPMGADFGAYKALVLTPEPRLADVG